MNNDKVVKIALADIQVKGRSRAADPKAVEALAVSISQHGLMSPIEVAKISYGSLNKLPDDPAYRLVCGGHRLAAFKALGETKITAFIVKGNRDELRVREILENVSRSELTMLERACFTAELREVVVRLYGDEIAGHGGGRGQERNLRSWTELVAERTGWSKDTTKRAGKLGEKINAELAQKLAGSVIANNQKALEDLVKLKLSNDLAFQLIDQLDRGEAKTVKEAHLIVSGGIGMPEEISQQDAELKKLQTAWGNASQATQRIFWAKIKDFE